MELILDVIDIPNMPNHGPINEIPIKAAVRVALAGYSTILQVSTEPFHRECPVTPNWTPAFDAVCNVEEAVDWKGANWEAFGVTLVINPNCHQSYGCVDDKELLPFITLNPFLKTYLDPLNLFS